jgi:hypothetical protein
MGVRLLVVVPVVLVYFSEFYAVSSWWYDVHVWVNGAGVQLYFLSDRVPHRFVVYTFVGWVAALSPQVWPVAVGPDGGLRLLLFVFASCLLPFVSASLCYCVNFAFVCLKM